MPMFMAVLTVEFSLDGNDNLKAKRRVANSLKQKTRQPHPPASGRGFHFQQRNPPP